MVNKLNDTNLTESDKYVLRKGFWHMACIRAWEEAACSGPNYTLERHCHKTPLRIVTENNMEAHGRYIDDRSDGTVACPNEKDATTGFNILRLVANYTFDGLPVIMADCNAPSINQKDSQRGIPTYIETAARTPAHRLRKSIMTMGTDCIEKQEALDRYAVYLDSCASNSVV